MSIVNQFPGGGDIDLPVVVYKIGYSGATYFSFNKDTQTLSFSSGATARVYFVVLKKSKLTGTYISGNSQLKEVTLLPNHFYSFQGVNAGDYNFYEDAGYNSQASVKSGTFSGYTSSNAMKITVI